MDSPDFKQSLREIQLRIADMMEAIIRAQSSKVSMHLDDAFTFTTMSFLSKQMTHADSLLRLGNTLDVQLISRTMIEGFIQFSWISKELAGRAGRWRKYAAARDWLAAQRNMTNGEKLSDELLASLKENYENYGGEFKIIVKKKLASGRYDIEWIDTRLWKMSKEIELPEIYRWYEEFSDWSHWNMYGVGHALRRDGERVVYDDGKSERIISANKLALLCLANTAAIASSLFEEGPRAEILRMFLEACQQAKV
jgi:hypothetical protein